MIVWLSILTVLVVVLLIRSLVPRREATYESLMAGRVISYPYSSEDGDGKALRQWVDSRINLRLIDVARIRTDMLELADAMGYEWRRPKAGWRKKGK